MPVTTDSTPPGGTPPKKRYVRAVGPKLRLLLLFIFGLVAVLAANSVYLGAITFLEWVKADSNQSLRTLIHRIITSDLYQTYSIRRSIAGGAP